MMLKGADWSKNDKVVVFRRMNRYQPLRPMVHVSKEKVTGIKNRDGFSGRSCVAVVVGGGSCVVVVVVLGERENGSMSIHIRNDFMCIFSQ
jgi:hypothetical protein